MRASRRARGSGCFLCGWWLAGSSSQQHMAPRAGQGGHTEGAIRREVRHVH